MEQHNHPQHHKRYLSISAKSETYNEIIQMEVSEGSETKYGGHLLGYRQMKNGKLNLQINHNLRENMNETIRISLYLASDLKSRVFIYLTASNNSMFPDYIISILIIIAVLTFVFLIIISIICLISWDISKSSEPSEKAFNVENQIIIDISSEYSDNSL